jgi:glyoxylase-like metal-dependent hydrolase (beta-lactamase superfamily II)
VHSIEGITHADPRGKVFPYLFVEDQDYLTLIDPSFLSQLPILENYLLNVGYDIKNVKRIILTHVHMDHSQAANEIKRSGAKIYSHRIESRYLIPVTLQLYKGKLLNLSALASSDNSFASSCFRY